MDLSQLSAYVLTFNEEDNIRKCLEHLSWAKKVVVVDSGSTDQTSEIVNEFSNAKLVTRSFDNHRNQHEFALSLLNSPWVLRLDADWLVSKALLDEIEALNLEPNIGGYRIPFHFSIHGELVPINVYPPVTALFRRQGARYVQDGHTERLMPKGEVAACLAPLIHEDKKSIDRFLQSQIKYSKLEFEKFSAPSKTPQHWKTRIRATPGLAPLLVAIYLLVFRGGLFRGQVSWHYILQKIIAECAVSLRLLDEKIKKR